MWPAGNEWVGFAADYVAVRLAGYMAAWLCGSIG